MNAARRRFFIALACSAALHALFFLFAPSPAVPKHALSARAGPMIVTLEEPAPTPAAVPPPSPPTPRPPTPARPPAPKRIITARPRTPPAAPPIAAPPEEPKPAPAPPMPAPPAVDMLAMINARRARRAAEAAAQEGAPEASPKDDEGLRALDRNLQTLKGDDRTGGIFQILEKGSYDAEYAFNGWRPDTHRRWREVIEVHVKPGEDIDRGIVRSMIALIRTHYTGDFLWESRRLGRVVTLSARPEDNDGLEEFLLREFFGTPLINRPPAQR